MTETQLSLDGVALRQHEEPYLFDYEPYAHQLALREHVGRDEEFIAVNDSPTGGGKTSSWLAPALSEEIDTIAIYPTNALVVDQTEQVNEASDAADHEVSVLTVTSEKLADKRSEFGVQSNGEAIHRWYRAEKRKGNQVILLTNPDIFVMMCRDLYRNASRAYKRFPFIVVDEFHRAGQKEQNTLRYLLDELYERPQRQHKLDKIVFLSATPDEQQERRFKHAMAAPYYLLTETDTTERTSFSGSSPEGWGAVMPPVELDVRTAPTFGTADRLLGDDLDDLISFCRDQSDPDADRDRVAIILDGIHEVQRVFEQLDDELDRQVERIDGFHSENKAKKLHSFDVLVSNSAVEVGIDFDIDRLLFAGHNHASFLQRLGRLRTKTKTCRARCYVPRQIAHDLSPHEDKQLTRRDLDEILDETYPEPRQPTSFGWRYSAPEELQHIDNRLRDASSEQQDDIVIAGQNRIQRHFLDGTNVRLDSDDIQRAKESIDWRVLEKLQWYRGDSVQALVYDQTEDTVRTYDLFYLLRYGDVEFVTEVEFERIVPAEYEEQVSRTARYVDGFCLYSGTIQTTEDGWGRSVAFTGPRLSSWLNNGSGDTSRVPKVVDGVKLSVDPNGESQNRIQSLSTLNDRLRSRRERTPGNGGGLLCYPVSTKPTVTKERYNLDEFFFLYPVALQGETAASLALGTDALYLHCHVMEEDDDEELIGL
ncbi:type I-D CRISPR-associated helicase Cas3' [Halovenus sp. HT40]|uniref:type I-D CRISPR-associated helicase Cas3' n=1 Tax=Halovenus sp. HT40 TaxID=3126691 RepID=UPI00300EAAED